MASYCLTTDDLEVEEDEVEVAPDEFHCDHAKTISQADVRTHIS